MAGGPIYPSSAYPADSAGRLFPNFFAGAGGNAAPHDEGLGVIPSLDADATWELRFPMPPSIPTGTLKLRLLGLSSGSTGNAKITIKDGNVAAGSSPSAVTLTSETQQTVSFTSGATDGKYQEVKVPLSASPNGNDMLVVALTFNASGWTLAATSTWIASVLWE